MKLFEELFGPYSSPVFTDILLSSNMKCKLCIFFSVNAMNIFLSFVDERSVISLSLSSLGCILGYFNWIVPELFFLDFCFCSLQILFGFTFDFRQFLHLVVLCSCFLFWQQNDMWVDWEVESSSYSWHPSINYLMFNWKARNRVTEKKGSRRQEK